MVTGGMNDEMITGVYDRVRGGRQRTLEATPRSELLHNQQKDNDDECLVLVQILRCDALQFDAKEADKLEEKRDVLERLDHVTVHLRVVPSDLLAREPLEEFDKDGAIGQIAAQIVDLYVFGCDLFVDPAYENGFALSFRLDGVRFLGC